jgi:hypothetical protein
MPDTVPSVITIFVKRYAAGKAFAFADGDAEYAAQARRALARSLITEVKLDHARFITMMRDEGVPALEIGRYLSSVSITDEAWLQEEFPR